MGTSIVAAVTEAVLAASATHENTHNFGDGGAASLICPPYRLHADDGQETGAETDAWYTIHGC